MRLADFAIDTSFPVLADFIESELGRPDVAEWVRRCEIKHWYGHCVIGITDGWGWSAMTGYPGVGWIMASTPEDAMKQARDVIERYLNKPPPCCN